MIGKKIKIIKLKEKFEFILECKRMQTDVNLIEIKETIENKIKGGIIKIFWRKHNWKDYQTSDINIAFKNQYDYHKMQGKKIIIGGNEHRLEKKEINRIPCKNCLRDGHDKKKYVIEKSNVTNAERITKKKIVSTKISNQTKDN